MRIAALFDADGTLLDTMELHGRLAADCMAKHFGAATGITYEIALQRYHETTGIPISRQLERLFPGDEHALARAQCVAEYAARKGPEVYAVAPLFEDVHPVLYALSKDGVSCFVSTSTERDLIHDSLARHRAADYFEALYGPEDGTKPAHISQVRVRYPHHRLVFVGDTPSDAALADQDIVTICRTSPQHPVDELLAAGARFATDSFLDLPAMIWQLDPDRSA